MFYLVLGSCVVWVCLLSYLLAIDRQVRHLQRRLEARRATSPERA
ncbi:MAG: CcmD family protein [Planctomycetes bacterium]|nr:CcmD family protein [Planctomycetota bacterium]